MAKNHESENYYLPVTRSRTLACVQGEWPTNQSLAKTRTNTETRTRTVTRTRTRTRTGTDDTGLVRGRDEEGVGGVRGEV